MEFHTRTLKVRSLNNWISLHFIGDVHVGQGNHNRERLLERREQIQKDPQALWLGIGDYGDQIFYTDPRFDPNSLDETMTIGDLRQGILGQVRRFCNDLEPIKGKCLGVLTGNHEETIERKYHTDPTREIAYRLNVPYHGYCSLTRLHVVGKERTKSLVIFAHHGYGAGRRHGAQINKIEDAVRICPSADIYAMGHVHGKVASTLDTIDISQRGGMLKKQRAFVITGSYAETYKLGITSYAEKNMFTEAGLASPTVHVRWADNGKKQEIQITI